ncbi:MAG: hypothetical protein ACHQFZ_05135 [Acidimicrobiales bacterium]
MTRRVIRPLVSVVLLAPIVLGLFDRSFVEAATNWIPLLGAGSHGEGQAQPAITSATGNPVTFTATCASSSESGVLSWSSAGTGVTGYEVLVSSTINGTFALDATQPAGTALTITETYTSNTGNKFYRLEAKSAHWAFPGTTITNARQAAVSGTNGGFLTMASSGTRCTATA